MRLACPAIGLPQPDLWIGGVGTELACDSRPELAAAFQQRFTDGWDRNQVLSIVRSVCPGALEQPEEFQQAFKSSWFVHNATANQLSDLADACDEAGLQVTVVYFFR